MLQNSMTEVLGLFFERSPALLGIKGLDGRYVFANEAWEKLYGVTRGALEGRTDFEFASPGDAVTLRTRDRAVMNSGRASRSLDRFRLAEGDVTLASVRFPHFDGAGRIIGVGCVAIDVTAKQAESIGADPALAQAQQHIAELRQALETLRAQAATDSLTGIMNRMRLEECIQMEVARFARYGRRAALIFLDIDHFKQINDTLGHAAGDETLRQICRCVQENIRETDLFGRWGGEEFLLLLPNTDLALARGLAEKIRKAIDRHEHSDSALVSASFGVAQIQTGEDWEAWVARADAAMYTAKRKGRDRVEVDFGEKAEALSLTQESGHFVHLVWRPNYECGEETIDRQHRQLFESANSLISAMLSGWSPAEIREILDHLLADVVEHFACEEALLDRFAYSAVVEHQQIHARLLERAAVLSQRILASEDCIGEAFHFLVYEVIAQHMLAEDKKFFPCFAESAQETVAQDVI